LNFSIIAAISTNQVIGSSGAIPWSLPEDLKYFQKKTLGSSIVMGRKTYESIGKPLPNRNNIVISSSLRNIYGIVIIKSVNDLIKNLDGNEEEIFIIGGQKIYEEFLPLANKLIITEVKIEVEGDTFFPFWDRSEWSEISREEKKDSKSKIEYDFVTFEKRN